MLFADQRPGSGPLDRRKGRVDRAAGQALVAILVSPVNPSDLLTLTGDCGVLPPLPAIGGREGVGRVVAEAQRALYAELTRLMATAPCALASRRGIPSTEFARRSRPLVQAGATARS